SAFFGLFLIERIAWLGLRSSERACRVGRLRWGDANFAATAELRSAWTGEAPVPTRSQTGGGARLSTITKNKSPEVMLNSFLSASSSRLDPCWPYSYNSLAGAL